MSDVECRNGVAGDEFLGGIDGKIAERIIIEPSRPSRLLGRVIDTDSAQRAGGLKIFGANMKILAIKKSANTPFDFKTFSDELRKLSERHGVNLVSVGAMSGLDAGGEGTTYLAIWSAVNSPNRR